MRTDEEMKTINEKSFSESKYLPEVLTIKEMMEVLSKYPSETKITFDSVGGDGFNCDYAYYDSKDKELTFIQDLKF